MADSDPPITEHYDALAADWAEIATTASRRHVLWSSVRDMLPDLEGARVLDAGCGSGVQARRLLEAGAEVVAVDASEKMVREATDRLGDAADVRVADLSDPLPFLDEGGVDVVLCMHVLSHVADPEPTLAEFARVLRPGGTLVLSTHHPFHDFLVVRDREYPQRGSTDELDLDPEVVFEGTANYHETQRYDVYWGGRGDTVPGSYYRRSLSALLETVLDAGFALDDVVEPTPDEELRRAHPDLAAELHRAVPSSVCLRATR